MVEADPAVDGTVWISEDVDPEDPMLLTGRFSGHFERHERLADEFEGLEVEDAIAWGRARAATVLIRTGDSGGYFSAGEHHPDPRQFPAWPPPGLRLERRRPRGFEALDNTERDPPVLWDARIEADLGWPVDVGSFGAVSAAFLVEASTRKQAERMADGILKEALAALVEALPSGHGGSWTCGVAVYLHRPGKPATDPGVT